ncbi:PTAC15 [Forsythia ovata]|uniref:PTAC15 n=1 Tax=Forsythia ovata TaxID=205694 RepID=A0ABD1WNK2_9LAMI
MERMLHFLNRLGGVSLILRRLAILNYDLEAQLAPRIEFLLELSGGDEKATGTVLHKLPFVLAYSVDHLKDHVEFLRSYADQMYVKRISGKPSGRSIFQPEKVECYWFIVVLCCVRRLSDKREVDNSNGGRK